MKLQAEQLLRDALSQNKNSAINNSSFLGRFKKLLFKPTPRKLKAFSCLGARSESRTLDDPVTPFIARGYCLQDTSSGPVTQTIARGSDQTLPSPAAILARLKGGSYDDDEYYDGDPSVATPDYREDPVVYMPPGHYNSK